MTIRTSTSFYAVWKIGLEWPELFANAKMARDRAHRLAKDDPGTKVHVMKIVSQGTVQFAGEPTKATGLAA